MKKYSHIIIGTLLIVGVLGVWLNRSNMFGATPDQSLPSTVTTSISDGRSFDYFVFFKATTTNATSTTSGGGILDITGAKKITLFFTRGTDGTANTGTTRFNIQVTPDGTEWVDYNKLISNVTNTNAQTLTRVANLTTAAGTTTSIVAVDLEYDAFKGMRCIAVEITDGAHTCSAAIER